MRCGPFQRRRMQAISGQEEPIFLGGELLVGLGKGFITCHTSLPGRFSNGGI